MLYAGGVVGYLSGSLTDVIYEPNANSDVQSNGELLFNVGSSVDGGNYVSTKNAMYIGGIAGSVQKLQSADSDLVSKLNNVKVQNVEIVAYLNSKASIGGVVGINEWDAAGLYYKNSNLDVYDSNDSDPGSVISSEGEQDLSVYVGSKTKVDVGGVIGFNTYSILSNLNTNANIYFKDNSAYSNTTNQAFNIGGIIGKTYNISLISAIQESHTMLIDSNGGDFKGVGGLIGKIDDTVAQGVAEVSIAFSISTIDIVVTGTDTYIVAGGFIGDAAPSILSMTSSIVYSNVSILSRKENEPHAKAVIYGGIAGQVKEYIPAAASNGTVVAVTFYYPEVANIELVSGKLAEYSVGQLFGIVTTINTTGAYTPFDGLYYNETLFGFYTNQYFNSVTVAGSVKNLSQTIIDKTTKDFTWTKATEEDKQATISLAERVNLVISTPNNQNMLTKHIKDVLNTTHTTVYSRIEQYIEEDEDIYSQVSGTKLNPIEVTGSGVSFEAYKHYELIADYTISSPITLNKGVFFRANGFTIKCNSGTSYVFESIGQYAVVSGLLMHNANINLNASVTDKVGMIAKTNNGMLISCGTSGTIKGKNVAGLVGTNNGIILNCFSIATVTTTDGIAAGLVVENAATGSILSSLATGLISSNSSGSASGFVNSNAGYISSCYTVSNVFGGENSYSNIYAFVKTNTKTLKYNYYDENAYTGDHKAADDDTKHAPTQTSKLTNIYSMGDLGVMAKNLDVNGNWYSNSYPVQVILNSDLSGQYTTPMTNTWFNYGYGVVNVDYTIASPTGKARLLNMLYTGNGKQEDGNKTNGFFNSPYQITNAGIFEAFVLGDHSKGVKSYYILMNDISFAAYDNWSDSWDENGVFFRGDLDGNNKKLKDLNSRHGLFRVFADEAYAYDFTITEAYSQTGILAAYMTSSGNVAKIKNVDILTTKLEGKNENVSNKTIAYFFPSPTVDNAVAFTMHFAGGIIGYLEGGVLDDVNIVKVDDEDFVVQNNRDGGWVGGYVGYYTGGEIKPTDKTNVFKNAATVEVEGVKAGAYIGYANNFTDSGLTVESNVNVTGTEIASGFIAHAVVCQVTNSTSKAIVDGEDISAGFVGKMEDSTLTTCKYIGSCDLSANTYAGGLVGYASDSTIKNCEVTTSKSIASYEYAGGIIAKAIDTTITYDNATADTPVTVSEVKAVVGAGGIAGYVSGSIISGTSANVLTSNCAVKNYSDAQANVYLGGIVGVVIKDTAASANITNSQIEYVKNTGAVTLSTISGKTYNAYIGGIAGRVDQTTDIENATNAGSFSIPTNAGSSTVVAGGIVGGATNNSSVVKLLTVTNNANMSGYAKHMGGVVGQYVQSGSENNLSAVYNNATIENTNTTVHTKDSGTWIPNTFNSTVGGIVGHSTGGKITTAVNKGAVTGTNAAGIVSHSTNGTISASSNEAAISGTEYAGGLVATTTSVKITASSNASTGTVAASTGVAGGIIAYGKTYSFDGTVTNNADITGIKYTGGVVGYSHGISSYKTIENKGTTISGTDVVGGVFGQFVGGTITNANSMLISTTATSVKATSATSSAGGVIGYMSKGEIYTASAMTLGTATISANSAGGFVGTINSSDGDIVISEVKLNTDLTFDNSGVDVVSAGGIIGVANKGTNAVTLSKLESTAKTISASLTVESAVGGLVGVANAGIIIDSSISKSKISIVAAPASGQISVGGTAGKMEGSTLSSTNKVTAKNEIALGTLTAAGYNVGGFVGWAKTAIITNMYNESGATITGTADNKSNAYVGGIVGRLTGGTISFTSTNATVETSTQIQTTINVDGYVGGFVGYADDSTLYTINSTSKKYKIGGDYTGWYVGGLIGYSKASKGSIIDKFNVNPSKVLGDITGGVIGVAGAGGVSVTNCTVNVTSLSVNNVDESHSGGVIGYSAAEITVDNCAVKSKVNAGNAASAGGIVGKADTTTITITNNTVENSVSGESYAGGIVGNLNVGGTITGNSLTTTGKSVYAYISGGIIGYLGTGAASVSVSGNKLQNQTIDGTFAGAVVGEYVGTLVGSGSKMFGDTYSEYKDCDIDASYGGFFIGKASGGSTSSITYNVTTSEFTGFNVDSSYFGVVIGYIAGTYSNITSKFVLSTANVEEAYSSCYLGGVVGYIDSGSTISSCSAANGSSISLYSLSLDSVGGIIGYAYGAPEVKSCKSDAAIEVKAYAVGGICGESSSTSFNDCNTVSTSGKLIVSSRSSTTYAGGIVGYAYGGTFTSCANKKLISANNGDATDEDSYAGGIIGYASSLTIDSCTNEASVSSHTQTSSQKSKRSNITSSTVYDSDYSYDSCAGGIVGFATGCTIKNNKNSSSSIYGNYSVKTSSNSSTVRSYYEWCTFSQWTDYVLFVPTTENYQINLRLKLSTGGITGYEYSTDSNTYSGNETVSGVSKHTYTKGRGFDWSGTSSQGYLWDWFKPEKVQNELYNQHMNYVASERSGISI